MTRRHLAALVAITFLAAFLRFYKLDVLPPGLFGDEALVTLLARDSVATNNYPIYFAADFGGYHPAIVYLTIVARWLTNNHPYAIRFGVAMMGFVIVLTSFWAFWAILRLDHSHEQSLNGALLAALIFSCSFPFILVSRLGFEVILPALGALAVFGFLSIGLRTDQRRYLVLSGLCLGLSLYTYYSARLLPMAVVVALIWIGLVSGRAHWRSTFTDLFIVAFCSAIAFVPLGVYFLINPNMFFARAVTTTSSNFSGTMGTLPFQLLQGTVYTLLSTVTPGLGDPLWRHNISGRPVFDIFTGLLFVVGGLILLKYWRTRSSILLGSWASMMLLPVILTMTGTWPTFTRMMGAFPALALIAAWGGLKVYSYLTTRFHNYARALVGLGLAFSILVNSYDYFVRWANDPALFDAFQVGGWRAANLALERTKTGRVLLSPEVLDDPSDAAFNVLLRDTSAQQFPGPDCLAYYDQPDVPVTFISSTLHDSRTFDRVHSLFPTGHEGATIIHEPDPWPLYQVFEVPAGAKAQPPSHLVSANFGDQIELIGYDLDVDRYRPGDTVHLTLYWRARVAPNGDYNAFVHLYASDNYSTAPVAQTDGAPCSGKYFTSRWQAGEIVLDERTLALPADGLTGSLPLAVGLYGWPSLERLPVTASDAILPDNRFLLTSLDIQP